jgi:hypothetical protein
VSTRGGGPGMRTMPGMRIRPVRYLRTALRPGLGGSRSFRWAVTLAVIAHVLLRLEVKPTRTIMVSA